VVPNPQGIPEGIANGAGIEGEVARVHSAEFILRGSVTPSIALVVINLRSQARTFLNVSGAIFQMRSKDGVDNVGVAHGFL
jgi:hypothetical protein